MFYPTTEVKDKVENAPLNPGTYIYRNEKGDVLYVGKAVNLRNRTRQYFQNFERLDPKIAALVVKIRDVEYVTTDSEVEALILETNLIKKYRPKYNRLMKDDKNYIYVMIPKGTDFPKVELVREKKIKNADYYGPYPNTMPIRRTLRRMRHIFPYRTCKRQIEEVEENGKKVIKTSDPKPCLYFYLGLCNAPCAGNIAKTEYMKWINDIRKFFRGEKSQIVEELKTEMQDHSKNMEFEKAAIVRDKINDIQYVTQTIRIDRDDDEVTLKYEKEQRRSKALEELIAKLDMENLGLVENFKIETYDISNIQGTNATASMVVMVDGKIEKSLYRKFKIKTKSTPDDFEMMREVFQRRFKRKGKDKDESFDFYPHLIIVDGGKGQLSAAYHVLQDLSVDIPIVGLAKREEEIFKISEVSGELEFKRIKLSRRSEALYMVQNIRDEAHRFALGYHRKLRSGAQIKSSLDDIPGIGKIAKIKLLKAFGSSEGIKKASKKELLSVLRNSSTVDKLKRLL